MTTTKLLLASLALFLFSSSDAAFAEPPGRFGVGLGSGTLANGLSGKFLSGGSLAFQGVIGSLGGRGWGNRYSDNGGLGVSLDALLEQSPHLADAEALSLNWNAGLGVGLGSRQDYTALAVSGILGLEFNFKPVPIDLVLELRPSILIEPTVDFDIDVTAHFRVWFQ